MGLWPGVCRQHDGAAASLRLDKSGRSARAGAFSGAIIAVAELPLMLVLSVLWDVGSALVAWIWKAVTKQRNW